MPMYKFECDRCGAQEIEQMTFEEHDAYRRRFEYGRAHGRTPCLTGIFRQVMDFHFNRGMREHYSDQLGTHVTSERDFNDGLKRHAEEYNARTGLEAHFETIDPNDPVAAGVTDAGLESQERVHHNLAADGHKSTFS